MRHINLKRSEILKGIKRLETEEKSDVLAYTSHGDIVFDFFNEEVTGINFILKKESKFALKAGRNSLDNEDWDCLEYALQEESGDKTYISIVDDMTDDKEDLLKLPRSLAHVWLQKVLCAQWTKQEDKR